MSKPKKEESEMQSLKEKHVLLTGGSRGLGAVIAEALAQKGANVALAARREEDLNVVADHIRHYGVKTLVVPVDLENAVQRRKLLDKVLDKFGAIDVLINNAGLYGVGSYLKLSWETICKVIEVNLIAPMNLSYLVLPYMVSKKEGHIVNIASVAGKRGFPYGATYSATKAGLAEWTRGLRLELREQGIHFTTLFPGYVMGAGMFAKTGLTPPWIIGSCTPESVAKAVIQGILKNRKEILVNSRPLQPILNIGESFPSFADWMMKKIGAYDLQRRMANE
jgi:short-subunit dehydrogenase